ncbi:MAG: adenylyl-sulfate reductase subunit alpha [Hydrogenophilales bacterium CG03_land_8_20_14_0_80_62_28]|nr:adenylyl-sulfate reductase subunit alpha [Betaproteobacteria bacterium]PIV22877.1 MAG: adenylyl-sulfate reductase subunit alpha [Hydrogenophilales bacterium CG03_land_8_20_14_0_80_62_28]PIW39150.1 MAG: adenylyl-sulfate reductase subunit alpha [Hydrogenophilales bacterium CG15_BIG_FIL_POST_REV_8_21_14_020_62_31]PIW72214.1 MAG: adenylyl-sulfate reductase subunit alpha [Hydrogenophilales bacterium CG12_big_fil_rev_8_21_14_0_65_61_21]PIX02718.1 MAG: adenylyl-sulfate reductase subunit alpha [Hydr
MMADFSNPEVVQEEVDILMIGGGMACCGAAYEVMRWAEAAKAETGVDLKIKLVDKAAMDRSGAVAQGLSAINTYIGDAQDPADYARMVSNDLMGITRDDLAYDCGRHVDDSVHMFEEWGLPIWKTDENGERHDGAQGMTPLKDGGKCVRSGKWQIMINGESYKWIVAEAAKKALGLDRIQERVFIVHLINDKNDPSRIAGAAGFSVRENKIYIYKAKAILLAAGGCVNIFRPRSVGEGTGRAWYPVWNAGSTYSMAAEAGAELTMMENRFVPARFKDGYGPVGAWFLLFKAQATNAFGEAYMAKNKDMLNDYPPYGQAAVPASCLRNHLMLHEMLEGRGPIWMDTVTALANMREKLTPREVKHLEAEAWEDFLDMSVGQCGIWVGENIEPEKKKSELMPTEPYLLGSHSGCCGIWVSGPTDVGAPTKEEYSGVPAHLPSGWSWGYRGMTTVKGLFTAGDGVGASGHKFSSGSHAEGRIAAKSMVKYCLDNKGYKPEFDETPEQIAEVIWKPVRNYLEFKDYTSAIDVNPNYITPKMLQFRLQKIMDEYVAGVATYYKTNNVMLDIAEEKLGFLKEDAQKMRAKDLHELLRAWENYHRILTAEAHMKHIQFREESRYPGFYYRMDKNFVDEENWHCFVNSIYDKKTHTWTCFKRKHIDLVDKSKLFKAAAH